MKRKGMWSPRALGDCPLSNWVSLTWFKKQARKKQTSEWTKKLPRCKARCNWWTEIARKLGGRGCVTLPKDQDRLKKCENIPPPKERTFRCHVFMIFRAWRAPTCGNGVGNACVFFHSYAPLILFLELLQLPLPYTSTIPSLLDFFLQQNSSSKR